MDGARPFTRVVRGDGQAYRPGDIVRLDTTPSEQVRNRITADPNGDHEILEWYPLPSTPPFVRVMLRKIR
jgi:hypothetical protein